MRLIKFKYTKFITESMTIKSILTLQKRILTQRLVAHVVGICILLTLFEKYRVVVRHMQIPVLLVL